MPFDIKLHIWTDETERHVPFDTKLYTWTDETMRVMCHLLQAMMDKLDDDLQLNFLHLHLLQQIWQLH